MQAVVCLLLFAANLLPVQAQTTTQNLKTWGYVTWWLPDGWRNLPLNEFDRLVFFELKADASGTIVERQGWPDQWQALRQAVAKNRTKLDLALSIQDHNTFAPLFGNPDAIKQFHNQALALAAQDGISGLHLDFEIYETIDPALVQALRTFVVQLNQTLRQLKPARTLSVFYPVGTTTALYDAATLALFDQVVVQGYDSHWLAAPTSGSLSPLRGPEFLTWEKAVQSMTALGVARQRILFSFPLYGYEWPMQIVKPGDPAFGKPGGATSDKGVSTTFMPVAMELLPDVQVNVQSRVQQYGASHDPVSSSSYYQFKRADGQPIEGWFEDWWSVARKTEFLQQEKLGGMAFFPLGYDQGELVEYFIKRQKKPLALSAPNAPGTAPNAVPGTAPNPAPVSTQNPVPGQTITPQPATTPPVAPQPLVPAAPTPPPAPGGDAKQASNGSNACCKK